jgi:hypothetical protein
MNLSRKSRMLPEEKQKQKEGRDYIPVIALQIMHYLMKVNPRCTWRYKKGVYDELKGSAPHRFCHKQAAVGSRGSEGTLNQLYRAEELKASVSNEG